MDFGYTSISDPTRMDSIAYCDHFFPDSNCLAFANGSILHFYEYKSEKPTELFQYKLYGDAAMLIPYEFNQISVLYVVLSSTQFCVLKCKNEEVRQIEVIQSGKLGATYGSDIGVKYSYSLNESVLIVQFFQENLQLFKITNEGKLVFIQNLDFYSSTIIKFRVLDSSHFAVLLNKFDLTTVYEEHKFNVLEDTTKLSVTFPSTYKNFIYKGKKLFIISSKGFLQTNKAKIGQLYQIDFDSDVIDIVGFKSYLTALTKSGKIYKIDNYLKLFLIGDVEKPFRLVEIKNSNYKKGVIIPSRMGDTKFFDGNNLTNIIFSPGKVQKFVNINERNTIGLTASNYIYGIEKTLNVDEMTFHQQFEEENRCWFFDENFILVSFVNTNSSQLVNYIQKNSDFSLFPNIDTSLQTIGFKRLQNGDFIQITKQGVHINSNIVQVFEDISFVSFSISYFAVVNKNYEIVILSNSGEILLRTFLKYKISAIALSDTIVAVSSWSDSTVYIFSLIKDNKEIQLKTMISNINAVDLLLIEAINKLFVLTTKDWCCVFLLDEKFSVLNKEMIFCEGSHYKIFPTPNNEVIVSGKRTFIIKNLVATEVGDDIPALNYFDWFSNGENILLSNQDCSVSIFHRQNYYKYKSKLIKVPYQIIDFFQNDVSQRLKNAQKVQENTSNGTNVKANDNIEINENEIYLLEKKDILEFNEYKMNELESIERIALIKNKETNKFYLIASTDYLYSLSNKFEASTELDTVVFARMTKIENPSNPSFLYIAVALDHKISCFKYMSKSSFVEISSINFENLTKPIGISYISSCHNVVCMVFMSQLLIYSFVEDEIELLCSTQTQGSSVYFSVFQKFISVGDAIESLCIYNFIEGKESKITEIYRDCHDMGISSCCQINTNYFLCVDQGSNLYIMRKTDERNFTSKNLLITGGSSIGTTAKAMILCGEKNDTVLVGSTCGDIIEVKRMCFEEKYNTLNFRKTLHNFYDVIDKSFESLGGFASETLREIKCSDFVLGIPKIIDIELFSLFLEQNIEQQTLILQNTNPLLSIETAEEICRQAISSL